MAPRYVPPHKRGEWRAAAAGGGMEPEEEVAEAAAGEQRRLGTARRVSARTPRADSVRCRREVRIATVAGFFPAEEERWETDSESDGWVTDDEPDTDFDAYYDSITAAHAAGDDARFTELVFAAAGDGGSFSDEEGSYFSSDESDEEGDVDAQVAAIDAACRERERDEQREREWTDARAAVAAERAAEKRWAEAEAAAKAAAAKAKADCGGVCEVSG